MNADATYQIGKDHKICEDYALAEVKAGLGYAIVCDGCSASPDVDFGARILAMAAKNVLLRVDPNNVHSDVDNFGMAAIQKANQIFETIPHLHPQALDATLLAAWVYDGKMTAVMYGDGVFIHRRNGVLGSEIEFTSIHLSSGAPDYLSYFLDTRRKKLYLDMEGNVKELFSSFPMTEALVEPETRGKIFEPLIIQKSVSKGDVIAVCSDGINTFRKPDNTPLSLSEMVEEFTGFKTTEGEFVHRRIAAMKRKHVKDLVTHGDDISIAAIVV